MLFLWSNTVRLGRLDRIHVSCKFRIRTFILFKSCYFREHIFLSLSRLALRAINFLGSRRQRMCIPGMRVAARVVLNM